MQVLWTLEALERLTLIREEAGQVSSEWPQLVIGRIETVIAEMASFPLSGRVGRLRGTREWVVARTPYVIVYRPMQESVVIVTVVHGRQDWPGVLREP
ncbi:type II toxin-antitoxin system RelE/ParE family toxin [Gloeobacter morelensis]|uniref:Type II toxin-antitoxin system RelE/ParE family toxin n=1 Tax=Gloeobacter morelensis MG652769 TaxID=2781736 RepID=A0ABY3PHA6_9CYAN|nr:type II toxin-antitoxin system RelE/ParE family toxin [Gloeobacter morelensis]UFP93019.1 type II toxin-antitoxin system RelE/ParE family toxin [Gloeobacter morelensis MG652769]